MKTKLFILMLILIAGSLKAQELQKYIKFAEENNPGIKAMETRYRISEEKIEEANSLPNTEFSGGYFVSTPETRTGPQVYKLSARQMLPWFGTISSNEDYATAMANTDYMKVEIAKRKLGLNIAQSYYRLYALTAKQKVLEQNIELLKTYHELALNSVETGSATAVEVLKLQIRQNDLQEQMETLQLEFSAEKADFNSMLNQNPEANVEVADSVFIPTEDVPVSLDVLKHPELLELDLMSESINKAEKLNEKQAMPNLGIGLDYVAVSERPNMNMNDNGKDILMPMVSISIPIFNNKFKSISRQNELQLQEISSKKQDKLNTLKSLLESSLKRRKAARISYKTQLKNLSQANNAEEILRKNYETGTIDFQEVLDIQELQLKFQMNLIEAVKKYYSQSATINYLTEN